MTEKGGMTVYGRKHGKKETVHSRDFWKRYCIKTTLTERIRESRQTRERQELMA